MVDRKSMKSGVYAIRNKVNGKQYVGSAKVFLRRWYRHSEDLRNGSHHSVLLQRAWNKYGEDSFEFRILEETTAKHAVAQEQVFLNWLQTYDPRLGYNISPTANSSLGVKFSQETKAKMSAARKGKTVSKKTRERLSAIAKGRTYSPEICLRMSLARKGKPQSKEAVTKRAAANRGKTRSDESRKRMSAAQKGRTVSAEGRLRMSAAKQNMSRETREKIAAAQRGKKLSAESIKKRTDSLLRNRAARKEAAAKVELLDKLKEAV